MAWNSGTRKYTSIIARAGTENPKTHYREFCIIDYVDSPAVISDDVFYVSKEDLDRYLGSVRYPPGSALTWIGSFHITEEKLLVINELKLVYCHTATYLSYSSSVNCLFNIRSFYERAKTLKKYEEDKLLKEQLEDERKQEAIKAARARLDTAREKQKQIEEAERKINDESTPIEEKMKAVAFLGK